jgi:hypothetical protein
MAICPFSPRRNMANLGDYFPAPQKSFGWSRRPFFFVWCEISPEIIKRCSHNRTARQGSLFNFCVIENFAIISKKLVKLLVEMGFEFLVESFPKTPRTQSEASGFSGSHNYKNKTNRLGSIGLNVELRNHRSFKRKLWKQEILGVPRQARSTVCDGLKLRHGRTDVVNSYIR